MKFLALALLPLVCAAADTSSGLDPLIDAARSAPAEFASDAMIRIAASEKLGKARRADLLEEAFRRAAEAQEPYKRRPGTDRPDGRVRFLDRAFRQDLDTLSLRLRAIEPMLALDPAKARSLFLEIPTPRPPAVACEDSLVFDLDRYYEVLAHVVSQTFSAKEIAKDEPFQVLLRYGVAFDSPAQVAPAARMLAALSLKDEQFQALVTAFAGSLKDARAEGRTFFATRTAGIQIHALVEACKRRNVSPMPLLEAYRLYLVRQGSKPRCADGAVDALQAFRPTSEQKLQQQAGDTFAYFNENLRVDPLQPISGDELGPVQVADSSPAPDLCQDAECRAAAERYTALVSSPEGPVYSTEQRGGPEWQNRLKDFLNQMSDWKESTGVSPADQFREESNFYGEALSIAPDGAGRVQAFRAMLDFLKRSRLRTPSRMEWLLPVSALVGRMSLDPLGLGRLAGDLSNAGDLVISLYAGLEQLLPRTPAQIVPLM